MKKILAILIIIFTALMMSGCGEIKISGTYISEQNSDEYYEFSGESIVEYHLNGEILTGSFIYAENTVLISFNSGEMTALSVKNDKTLYYGLNAYVKKGFWEKHWWKFVIGGVIIVVIEAVYKKITGRDLEDDIDKLTDD